MTSLWLDNHIPIPTDDFVSGASYDDVIVGAGITGLTAAVLLARNGHRVAVLEARRVGAGTTGNTTAKVSLLQGTQLSKVASHGYPALVRAYAEGNRVAFDWLADYLETRYLAFERRDAVSYATSEAGVALLDREYRLGCGVGMPLERRDDAALPFETAGAIVLPDQLQIDPVVLLAALAAELRGLGGVISEGVRVTGARASAPVRVQTSVGEITGDRVVLATGTPVLNRGLYFAKVSALRSYAQAFELSGDAMPDGMYLSVDGPTRSIRSWQGRLLTGGNGHHVGRQPQPSHMVRDLTQWTMGAWPTARLTHSWSAQDYSAAHHVPFVGWLPRGRGRIFLATGYDKWGLTNAVAAAMTLVADFDGRNTPWQTTLHHRITMPRAIARGIGENAAVGWWYARGYAAALSRRLPDAPPGEGSGVVGRSGLRPTAVSTVEGQTCALSAVCSHLGAVVTWNDAERSWDCPAHGSRFAADGTRLEGPATRDLPARSGSIGGPGYPEPR